MEKIDRVNAGRIGVQRLLEKLGTMLTAEGVSTGEQLFKSWINAGSAGVRQMDYYAKGLAVSAERMEAFFKEGEDLAKVADALEGMAMHHPRSDTPGYFKSMKLGTRTEDFHVSFRTETEAGAAVYRDTFANAKHNPLPDGRLKVIGLERVYPELYMYGPEDMYRRIHKDMITGDYIVDGFIGGHYLTPKVLGQGDGQIIRE